MQTPNNPPTSLMGSKTRSPCGNMSLYLKIAVYKQSTWKEHVQYQLHWCVLLQAHDLPCLYCFEDLTHTSTSCPWQPYCLMRGKPKRS